MKKLLISALIFAFTSVALIALHHNSLNSLLSAVEKSEATMESHSKINASAPKETLMQNGSRQYCLGGIEGRDCSFDPSIPLNRWIKDYLNENAGSTRDALLVDKFDIESVYIFPFFRRLNAARDLYLDHVDAWERLLGTRAICGNYDECFNKLDETRPTFRIANKAFLDSLWFFDSKKQKERIDEIFRD